MVRPVTWRNRRWSSRLERGTEDTTSSTPMGLPAFRLMNRAARAMRGSLMASSPDEPRTTRRVGGTRIGLSGGLAPSRRSLRRRAARYPISTWEASILERVGLQTLQATVSLFTPTTARCSGTVRPRRLAASRIKGAMWSQDTKTPEGSGRVLSQLSTRSESVSAWLNCPFETVNSGVSSPRDFASF